MSNKLYAIYDVTGEEIGADPILEAFVKREHAENELQDMLDDDICELLEEGHEDIRVTMQFGECAHGFSPHNPVAIRNRIEGMTGYRVVGRYISDLEYQIRTYVEEE